MQQPNSLDGELELSSREELIKKVKLLDAQNRAIAQTKSQVCSPLVLLVPPCRRHSFTTL